MRSNIRLTLWLLTISLFAACGQTEEPAAQPAASASPTPAAARQPIDLLTLSPESVKYAKLEVEEVVERDVAAPIEATGRIALNEDRTIRVGAFIAGRVIEVLVKVGDRVTEGQTLAKIHTHDVHEAEANLVQSRAALTQKRTHASFARTTLERAERLFQAKALSKQELDRAQVEYESAQQEVIHAEAELERSKGHLELLGLPTNTLNYDAPVLVKAPSGGIIMQREVTTGGGVNPGDHLFTISDLSVVWVMAEVQERQLPLLKVGQPISIAVAAYPNESFNGSIVRISDVLNPQTRMIEVRCLVDNRSGKLKPEMYALAKIVAGEKSKALMIRQSALQDIDGQLVIFVARDTQRFEKRIVKTGRQEGEMVEILEGAARGEKVVTGGGFLLKSELLKSRMAEEE